MPSKPPRHLRLAPPHAARPPRFVRETHGIYRYLTRAEAIARIRELARKSLARYQKKHGLLPFPFPER